DADASVEALQEQLGLRSAALADAKQKLEPLVKARLKERNEAAAANLAALGLDGKTAGKVAADEPMRRLAEADEDINEDFN
ncbi:MAG: hypothetical protein IJQ54_03800, partial [Kiritimatiellae bacterium]|nr:hypothetical protein [Kiritimatiellia bacterium]